MGLSSGSFTSLFVLTQHLPLLMAQSSPGPFSVPRSLPSSHCPWCLQAPSTVLGSHCPVGMFLPIFPSQPSSFYFLTLPLNVLEAVPVHQLQFPSPYHPSDSFASSPPSLSLKPFGSALVPVWLHKSCKDHITPQLCLSGVVWMVGWAGPPSSAPPGMGPAGATGCFGS